MSVKFTFAIAALSLFAACSAEAWNRSAGEEIIGITTEPPRKRRIIPIRMSGETGEEPNLTSREHGFLY